MEAQRAPFPSEVDEFAADDRISYSKQLKTYVLEDEQGQEWEWLAAHSKWTQTLDEALMQQQAEIYKVPGVDEDEPALNPAQKRKEAMLEDPDINPKKAKTKPQAKADAKAAEPRPNTAVYVTGLPMDTNQEEVRAYFKRFGLIAESVDDDEKRIKLYNDKDGNFKGEALIIYFRPESVSMAVNLADNAEFVREDPTAPTGLITVMAADRSYKAHKDDSVAEERTKPKPRGSRAQAKKKAQEMDSRLADWSDEDVPAKPEAIFDLKTAIVKNVFTFDVLRDDPNALQDIHEDMMEAASEFGEVKNLTIFDLEEDGIMTVRFATAEAAEAFGRAIEGRWYDGRKLDSEPATGKEKFKKSRRAFIDKEAEEAKRLEKYSEYIEGKGKDSANGDSST